MTADLANFKPEWNKLVAHRQELALLTLHDLCDRDGLRQNVFVQNACGLTLDFTRTHTTNKTFQLLQDLAVAQDFAGWREKLFSGYRINLSEGRAVLHTALRQMDSADVFIDGKNIWPEIAKTRQKMEQFVTAVRKGEWLGHKGQAIKTVVNIGIGGSDLGPRLVTSALKDFQSGLSVRFCANVDAAELNDILKNCVAGETLFVVVSKTFKTQETLLNAETAKKWLIDHLGDEAVRQHFVAVSTNLEEACRFGIEVENIFPIWDWVGGRFSLWSAVGLSIALAVGWPNYLDMLKGACDMDKHFKSAELQNNLPFILAAIGVWYRNFHGTTAQAILPYAERLREFPRYLQQLEMESNGKRVSRTGAEINYKTAPVIFGECGTVGQHSFHQLLHQGTDTIPADFIGIRENGLAENLQHRTLNAHLAAQVEALKSGTKTADKAKENPGDRPSVLVWLDSLRPYSLGALLSLYEHKVFTQGVFWGVNSFDQWGVELGKTLATNLLKMSQNKV